MALVTCPDCAASVSDAAPACPQCGRPTTGTAQAEAAKGEVAKFLDPKANARSCLGCIAVVFVVVVAIMLLSVFRVW